MKEDKLVFSYLHRRISFPQITQEEKNNSETNDNKQTKKPQTLIA